MKSRPTKPDIFADKFAQLGPEERAQLRAFILSPLYLKLLSMVAVMKPSAHISKGGSGERDEFSDARTNARLGEIRGWELYEAAVYLVLNEPKVAKQAMAETFPLEGAADAEWTKPISLVPPKK